MAAATIATATIATELGLDFYEYPMCTVSSYTKKVTVNKVTLYIVRIQLLHKVTLYIVRIHLLHVYSTTKVHCISV